MEINKSIIVYVLTDNVKSKHLDKLKSYFKDSSLFTINMVNFKSNNILESAFPNKVDLYNYQLKWLLKDAEEKHESNFIIIIRDNLITNLSVFDLTNKILSIVKKIDKFDIFYLFKYEDYCDKYMEEKEDNELNIYRSLNSKGLNGVILDPSARIKLSEILSKVNRDYKNIGDIIIDNIVKGKLVAKTSFPNIFDFNIDLIEKDEEYKYTDICVSSWLESKKEKYTKERNTNNVNSNYYLYIIGFIIVAALIFIFIKRIK